MKLVVNNSKKLILGFGGAGCSILEKLPKDSPFPKRFVNTDDCRTERNLEHYLLFSAKRPLAAQLNERREELETLLNNYSEIFVLVGLGGNAGSQLSLAFAELARKKGITVSGFVTLPFSFEDDRIDFARQTLASLEKLGCKFFLYDHQSEGKDKNRSLQDHLDKASETAMRVLRSA